jgi:predicted permease
MLMVGAMLMIRSFASLQQVRPGFEPEHLLTLQLSLPVSDYEKFEERIAFQQELEERLGGLPGVVSVSATSQLPLTGTGPLQPFAYDEASAQNWESVTADQRWIRPGFFETIGATLLEGRDFDSGAWKTASPQIIIDERLAALAFPGQSAVGQQLQIQPTGSEYPHATVIGVVAHVNLHDVAAPYLHQMYQGFVPQRQFNVVLRTSVDPEGLATAVQREIESMNPGIPVEDVRPMTSLVSEALAQARLSLILMSGFGLLALTLASVGIYGVISFAVSQRTREFGIRMALGEAPDQIRRGVLGEGIRLVAVSIVVGLMGAAALGQFVSSLLYGVDATDPITYAVVAAVLGGVATLASWVPARRATRIDPMGALRIE